MTAVPVHHTDTDTGPWDGDEQVARLGDDYTQADLKKVFAWMPAGADDKKSRSNWKMPHHLVGEDGKPGAANVKACQSVISVLNGGMGGADIPDADRQGVYDHVAAHLKDAGETPAELKSLPVLPNAARGRVLTVDEFRVREGLSPMPAAKLADRGAMPRTVQQRNRPFRGVELRALPDGTGGEKLLFEGYACVVEEPYEMCDWLGPYTEVVRSGAFTKTLSENADVPFKINHEGMTLARTKSGTMRLAEDTTGLHVEAELDPANPHVQALRSAMDRGDIDEMSFAFWVTRQVWSPDWEQRDILEVNLNKGDVSAVNYGANPNTAGATLNSRDLADHLQRLPAEERRDVFARLAAEFEEPPVILATRTQMGDWLKARAAEVREGKSLSAATMTTLQEVLDLVAAADTAVDEAQVVLSDLMDVPNPDDGQDDEMDPTDDEPDDGPDAGDDTPDAGDGAGDGSQANSADLALYEARLRRVALK